MQISYLLPIKQFVMLRPSSAQVRILLFGKEGGGEYTGGRYNQHFLFDFGGLV